MIQNMHVIDKIMQSIILARKITAMAPHELQLRQEIRCLESIPVKLLPVRFA